MDMRNIAIPALALLTSAACGFSSTLNAADYSYIGGGFLLDAEVENFDGDGFRFAGSFLVTREIYAFGSYDDVDLDNTNIDVSYLKLGAGYILPLNTTWDANLAIAYVDAEAVANNGARADDSGLELSAGVRGMIKPEIEVHGELNYIDLDDSDTYFTIGGDYYFNSNVSAGMDIDLGGDYETISIGAKYYFK